MAIAKMLKMKLVSISCEQDALLNALHKTGAVELKSCEPMFDGKKVPSDKSEAVLKHDGCESALNIITRFAKDFSKKLPPDGEAVGYDDFMKISERESEILGYAQKADSLFEKYNAIKAEIVALKNESAGYAVYAELKNKFSDFKGTQKTRCVLGTINSRGFEKLIEKTNGSLISVAEECDGNPLVVSVIYHVDCAKECEKLLGECGFSACNYNGNFTAADEIYEINEKIKKCESEKSACAEQIAELGDNVSDLRVLSDYYAFCIEKLCSSDEFLRTETAFLLEAYVPEDSKDDVLSAVKEVTRACYVEFYEIPETEFAPTLMKNKKVPRQFEMVTNLYSVPKYLSLDPNGVLGLFFAAFMGFINADVGYGILMIAGGFLFASKQKRETSLAKLARVMAYSGFFTVLFGFLVDSLFGIPFMRNMGWIKTTALPDPIKDFSSMAGINVPTMLLISLGMGVLHIMVGLFLTALIHFKHGRVWDGIFDGLVWDVFLAGLIILVLGMIGILGNGGTLAGAIMIIAAVAVGALTAGRHEKGIGKFTKGFGAVYGLINYMSDILSYARLYGLMLSGAQIASIISNNLALPMLTSPGGAGGIIACALIMLFGHAFNVAMGLLGAFVHDARLQYVEFFSRFYEGDGELFTPMGSKLSHVYVVDSPANPD